MSQLIRLRPLLDTAVGDWQALLQAWKDSDPGRALVDAVEARLAQGATVYPAAVLRAFELTPLASTRIVILGQDPYHGPGQAEGLAFSVPAGQRLPPSLRNILREWQRDLGLPAPTGGSLVPWARRGVLLLNSCLTVEGGQPASHTGWGWEALTDAAVCALADDVRPKTFLLWGAHAQAKAALVARGGGRHLVLQCNHPSPLSATRGPTPFVGCGHFSAASRHLERTGQGAQDWSLP